MVNATEIRVHMTRNDNITLKELAKKIGTSSATLSRWLEKGDMPTSAAEKIIEVLSIPKEEQLSIFFSHLVS